MANQLPPFLRHYDRLAAVTALALLMVSLVFLVWKGVNLRQEVQDYNADLDAGQPSKAQLTSVDTAADLALIAAIDKPTVSALLAQQTDLQLANLATPERRLLCVKCAKPIAWGAVNCTFCSAEQPKEVKIDLTALDTDGDGISDVEEVKLGLNPQDPNDVDEDADKDGFTNIEEYQAKTDMKDPKSHPGYETRIAVASIQGTKLKIRATNKMQLPSTKTADGKVVPHHRVTFIEVNDEGNGIGKAIDVKDGETIGKTGFVFVRYNEKPKVEIRIGKHKQLRMIDVSEVDLKRVSDGKEISTVIWTTDNPQWPGDPLLEQRATLEFDVPNVKPVDVAAGETFSVKGEKYTVLSVNAEKKVVRIKKNANNQEFELK